MNTIASLNEALAGRYEIEREVGQGGMAVVFLARDVRHARPVALKVLHPDLAAALGGERFLSEITTTANLQHPHILPLHDSGDARGHLFYVMPYVEGESLRDRLTREQLLPVDEAVRIAREVLAALDYAHRHGVVHRDIKPENILLHDGSALVADFGIALAVSAAGGPRMTQTGLSLGTPSYMSPEQAMGERVIDGRADIYAAGAMLYEMLIGEPPFTGPTAQAIVSRVLTEEPRAPTSQRKAIPPNVDAAIRRALQKLPADRFSAAAEMSEALARMTWGTGMLEGVSPGPTTRVVAQRRMLVIAASAAIVSGIGGAVVARMTAPLPPRGVPARFSFAVPPYIDRNLLSVAISPDGARIVFTGLDSTGTSMLLTRTLDAETPAVVPNTRSAIRPFFSPDGRQLGFVQDGALKRVPIDGGPVQVILPSDGRAVLPNPTWATDDHIYVGGAGIRRVASAGGSVETLMPEDSTHRWGNIAEVPGGRWLILVETRTGSPELVLFSIADRKTTRLGIAGTSPAFANGRLLYVDATGTLAAVPFDAKRGQVTGPRMAIIAGVRLALTRAVIAIARTGTVVFTNGDAGTAARLAVVDRTGKPTVLPAAVGPYRTPRWSPDGKRIVFTQNKVDAASNGDVWVYDIGLDRFSRLTFDGFALSPSWTADGRAIVFTHRVPGQPIAEWRVPADNSASAREWFKGAGGGTYEFDFSRDGKFLVYRLDLAAANRDIFVAPVDSPLVRRALASSPFEEHEPSLSPDDKWVAYVSDASGRSEVYVRRVDGASGVWPVSRNGGKEPRWNGTRELLFRNADSLFAVPIEFGAEARPGAPKLLFTGNYVASPWDDSWDVSRDGRFLFVQPLARQAESKFTVLLNSIP